MSDILRHFAAAPIEVDGTGAAHIQTRMPSVDEWLAQAKLDKDALNCGMYLVHNGVVRSTAKREVREGEEGQRPVIAIDFSHDAEGVQRAVGETLAMPGVHHVRVWLNAGRLAVGQSLMLVLVGADIRPRCIDALETLVEKIKSELVVEQEIYAGEDESADPEVAGIFCKSPSGESAVAL